MDQDANGAPVIGTPEIHRMLAEDRIREEQYKILLSQLQQELQRARDENAQLRAQLGESQQNSDVPPNVTQIPSRA